MLVVSTIAGVIQNLLCRRNKRHNGGVWADGLSLGQAGRVAAMLDSLDLGSQDLELVQAAFPEFYWCWDEVGGFLPCSRRPVSKRQ